MFDQRKGFSTDSLPAEENSDRAERTDHREVTRRARYIAMVVASAALAACGDGSDDFDEGGVEVVLYSVLVALVWIVGIALAFAVVFAVVLGTVLGIARAMQWAWNGSRRT